nr:MAG TPA: hypothetical protein [Caudoviricetes sp.]
MLNLRRKTRCRRYIGYIGDSMAAMGLSCFCG